MFVVELRKEISFNIIDTISEKKYNSDVLLFEPSLPGRNKFRLIYWALEFVPVKRKGIDTCYVI
jgi:hypothetical protein